ncbi:MAG: hypothetical protein NTW87_14105 [Planctomycetota bacterium]|nr:hypothetical protein [Planctomycetota bacterium]
MEISCFEFEQNRSERALQTALLAPALADQTTRARLLTGLQITDGSPITGEESGAATVMHFVWVLRDSFHAEREACVKTRHWSVLRERWVHILTPALTDCSAATGHEPYVRWATEAGWWRHPAGEYNGDEEYIVHPCHRTIGWTRDGIGRRIRKFGLQDDGSRTSALVAARKVMNTECDCFIQTPQRLIVIECTDKTEFSHEQRSRQQRLFGCLQRLLPRREPPIYVELSKRRPEAGNVPWLSWRDVEGTPKGGELSSRRESP